MEEFIESNIKLEMIFDHKSYCFVADASHLPSLSFCFDLKKADLLRQSISSGKTVSVKAKNGHGERGIISVDPPQFGSMTHDSTRLAFIILKYGMYMCGGHSRTPNRIFCFVLSVVRSLRTLAEDGDHVSYDLLIEEDWITELTNTIFLYVKCVFSSMQIKRQLNTVFCASNFYASKNVFSEFEFSFFFEYFCFFGGFGCSLQVHYQ